MPVCIESKKTFQSEAIPGVRFTVRRLNKIQRARRDFGIIESRQQLAAIAAEFGAIDRVGPDQRSAEQWRRMAELDVEYTLIEDEIVKPAALRAGLISIDGLEVDGEAVTVESLMDSTGDGVPELIEEIYRHCIGLAGLGAQEVKNSSSATTSAEQVGAESTTTAVPSAAN